MGGLIVALTVTGTLDPGGPRDSSAATVTRSVVISGGGTSTGAGTTIRSSIGQAIAGSAQGSAHGGGAGFWPPGHTFVIGVVETQRFPMAYRLYGCIPNPFNPSTRVVFDVPRSGGRTRIEIFDASGRFIRSLLDGMPTPGRHAVHWNGRDYRGCPLASGNYFVRLRAADYEHVARALLLK
jgi:hypothetical protein